MDLIDASLLYYSSYIYYYIKGLHHYITMDPIPWSPKYKGLWSKTIQLLQYCMLLQKVRGFSAKPLYCVVSFLCGPHCAPFLFCTVHFTLYNIHYTTLSTKFGFLAQNLANMGYTQH